MLLVVVTPGPLIGADICFGADIAGFLDLFVFLREIPLLSDILLVWADISIGTLSGLSSGRKELRYGSPTLIILPGRPSKKINPYSS